MFCEILSLKNKFNVIKHLGWVKSLRRGYTGIGYTFESLLGKTEDSLQLPDYNGIEIKTKRSCSDSYISLFCASPLGDSDYEIKRLYDNYGYRSPKDKARKVFFASIYSNFIENVGLFYKFSLRVCREDRKVYLLVFDKDGNLIDNSSYWMFDVLEEKLYSKMKCLAFVKAGNKFVNNIEYFKYDDISFYTLKNFDAFLSLLESGKIRITFRVGVFTSGSKIGQLDNHGTSFNIKEHNLELLYNKLDL